MRRCLLEPVPQVWVAAELLSQAVDAHRRGDRVAADDLFRRSDLGEVGDWFRMVVGPYKVEIHGGRPRVLSPPMLSVAERPRPRMPSAATKREILLRDGWHCRFCESPVIPKQTILAISCEYPASARWSDVASEQHCAFQAMNLQYDHVVPHSRGGPSITDNMLITCAVCNYGRMSFTLEESRLIDPRTRPIKQSSWDGLSSFFAAASAAP